MKKYRKAKKFLEEMRRVPIVSVAAANVGISRNTVYRWRDEDIEFKRALDEALSVGADSINDLAESKLVNHIQRGEPWALKYWLDNHKLNYVKPRLTYVWKGPIDLDAPPKGNEIVFTNYSGEADKPKSQKKKQ